MMEEIWKPVVGIENFIVSNHGNVFNTKTGNKVGHKNSKGYIEFHVQIDGKTLRKRVHQAVLEAFVGPANGLVPNHIDGVTDNNSLSNLEYVNLRENQVHSVTRRGSKYKIGVRKQANRFKAYIKLHGKNVYIGMFDTEDKAASAYANVCKFFGMENRYAG